MSEYYYSSDSDGYKSESDSESEIKEESVDIEEPLKEKNEEEIKEDLDTSIVEKALLGIISLVGGVFFYLKSLKDIR